MKQLLVAIALLLAPGLCLARTNCRSVELPDHFEAVCIGDEKATPVPDKQSAAAIQYGVTQQQTAPMQMQVPAPPVAAPAAQSQPSVTLPSQTPQTQTEPDTVIHRQGRQQYKKGMDDARDARQKLIKDLQQQGQPAQ